MVANFGLRRRRDCVEKRGGNGSKAGQANKGTFHVHLVKMFGRGNPWRVPARNSPRLLVAGPG
jgi:hypothetical protein